MTKALAMDREMILRQLEQAERHVADGRASIEKQERLIAQLERDGLDATEATRLLEMLLDTQALHERHLKTIQAEMEENIGNESARSAFGRMVGFCRPR